MLDEKNNSFTEGQKDFIYKKMLAPLKLEISQILLYDKKAALEFLQEYNDIIENEDSSNIIQRITELEFKMQNYMSKEGKEKVFEVRSESVLQRTEDLSNNSTKLSLEEFETSFLELKSNYEEDIENYSFKDREKVERELYALQANLIMRQVAQGKTADELQRDITEQDKVGLNIFVVEQINNLKQKDGLEDIVTKINNIVMTDDDAVLRPELWSLMNDADRGIEDEGQVQMAQPTVSTAMTVASPKSKNSFGNWISRLFNKEPVFPLQASDLKKINMEWLSKYIPESMVFELENDRLSVENMQVDNKYVPDSKAVIYRMFEERESARLDRGDVKQYEFLNENGERLKVIISETRLEAGDYYPYGTVVKMKTDDQVKSANIYRNHSGGQVYQRLNDALTYANLLDETFNTDFQQQLLQEIQDIYIDRTRTHKESQVYNNIMASFNNMQRKYNRTKLEFKKTEEARREQFYEKNRFREQLRRRDTDKGEKEEFQDVEQTITQGQDNNNKVADPREE